jgi:hypothetical protein
MVAEPDESGNGPNRAFSSLAGGWFSSEGAQRQIVVSAAHNEKKSPGVSPGACNPERFGRT